MPEVIGSTSSLHTDDAIPESLRNRISFTEMGTRNAHVGPQLGSAGVKPPQINGAAQLESFVFGYYSEVSVDVIRSAVQAVVTIIKTADLSEEDKKTEIEEIIGHSLDASQYDELKSMSQHVNSSEYSDDDDEDVPMETFSENEDDEVGLPQETQTESSFVALNDPIRFRNNTKVRPQDVDSHWLESKLRGTSVSAKDVIQILEERAEDSDQNLQALLGLENFAVYQLISNNKDIIFWYTKLAWALTGDERDSILDEINSRGFSIEDVTRNDTIMEDIPREVELKIVGIPLSGTRYMAAPGHAVQLPPGSTRFTTYNYEQYNVPSASDHVTTPEWPLVKISDLPEYAQSAFSGISSLNIVQSKVYDSIVNTDVNTLLCAPTGAGKSNVALLALTKCLNSGFRCVCIAPLKALVQEQVATLQSKLGKSNFVVAELSGDQTLSREQLVSVDVIVATPEKWDVVTRKTANVELLRSIGLVVIDEIHLLHDEVRGSVLENIVVRHLRQQFAPRLVGLSATLPNYRDIGKFLQVPPSGLHFFDAKYRPVPLEQKYIGVTPQSPIKQLKAINEACIEKVREIVIEQNKQVLVFVHSRKETETTRDLLQESFNSLNGRIGIHHAGLSRNLRQESESLFKKGELRVLVSTATLAWGVNLPAAAVIIKGTEYYDPKQAGWCQLSPQDVLQMLGRAGRPGFDTEGLGVIITSHKYLNYFASVATLAMPIQSYLIKRLCESLNAEIAAKTIHSIDDCVEWLEKTFWCIRAKADPAMYGDNYTVADIAHSALIWLQRHEAITYEYPNRVKSTFLGELAANFYISPESVSLYAQQLKPWLTDIDIIRVFSRSAEFASLPVRKSEGQEIKHLSSLAPIPVRDDHDTRYAKVGVLLQTYISRLHLSGLALSSDIVYIAQSASRLFRAIFELSVAAKWGVLARRALHLYLMVDRRQWMVGQSPLRQFSDCPSEILTRMEASQIPWQRYFDLNKEDLGRILRLSSPSLAATAFSYLQKFPRFNINAVAQPVSTNWIWIGVDIVPLFDPVVQPEEYWMTIETTRGHILHSTRLSLKKLASGFSTVVPVELDSTEGKSYTTPYLFVRLLSDKWMHSESETPVNIRAVRPPINISEANDTIQSTGDAGILTEYENLPKLVQQLAPLFADSERSLFIGMFPSTTYYASIQLVYDTACKKGERVLILSADVNALKQSLNLNSDASIRDVASAERESRQPMKFNKMVDSVDCVICEGLQKLGSTDGFFYEALISRLRIALGGSARFVGFGYPVTSAQSIAQWLGAKKSDAYNFGFDSLVDAPTIDVQLRGSSLLVSLWDIIPTIDQSSTTLLVVGSPAEAALVKEELDYRDFGSVELVPFRRKGTAMLANTTSAITICTSGQLFDARDLRADRIVIFMNTVALSMSDLLSLTLHAKQQVTILTENPEYCASCINSPIPLESNLHNVLEEVISPEIMKGNIKLPQDAMNWIMSTFLYRRVRLNPSYYQSDDLQDWLSEIVESAFEHLKKIKAIEFVDEESMEAEPLPACLIAANCGVPLGSLESSVPIVTESKQSWLINYALNESNLRILDARIDFSLANNNLPALFAALDQRQALVQSIPLGSSPLNQLPWIDHEGVKRCYDAGIHSIQDFVAIEDDDLRCNILGFDNENPKMVDVAEFVNHFPIVDIVDAQYKEGKLLVELERDIEPGEKLLVHAAPGYPCSSAEDWFLVGADPEKSIVLFEKLEVTEPEMTLSFDIDSGRGEITVWLICGSYIDADKEYTVN